MTWYFSGIYEKFKTLILNYYNDNWRRVKYNGSKMKRRQEIAGCSRWREKCSGKGAMGKHEFLCEHWAGINQKEWRGTEDRVDWSRLCIVQTLGLGFEKGLRSKEEWEDQELGNSWVKGSLVRDDTGEAGRALLGLGTALPTAQMVMATPSLGGASLCILLPWHHNYLWAHQNIHANFSLWYCGPHN